MTMQYTPNHYANAIIGAMRGKLHAVRTTHLSHMLILGLTAALLLSTAARPGNALEVTNHALTPHLIAPQTAAHSVKATQLTPYSQLHPTRLPQPNRHLSPDIHLPPEPPKITTPLTDCTSQPCIALSFDDGPSSVTTAEILTTLEQTHTAATFFLVGKNIAGNQTLVQRMTADGYEVGNHSWDHPNMTGLTPEQVKNELLSTQAAIVDAGAPLPHWFRPPYGAVSQQVLEDAGLQAALWNIDPTDWRATDPTVLAQTVINTAKPGGIVDLHDIHQVTADALPAIVAGLSAKGYKFVTVTQLLHSRDRPGNAPFYGYAEPVPAVPPL